YEDHWTDNGTLTANNPESLEPKAQETNVFKVKGDGSGESSDFSTTKGDVVVVPAQGNDPGGTMLANGASFSFRKNSGKTGTTVDAVLTCPGLPSVQTTRTSDTNWEDSDMADFKTDGQGKASGKDHGSDKTTQTEDSTVLKWGKQKLADGTV